MLSNQYNHYTNDYDNNNNYINNYNNSKDNYINENKNDFYYGYKDDNINNYNGSDTNNNNGNEFINYASGIQYTKSDKNTYTITINVDNHTLTLYQNGKVYRVYPVAVGKPSTPTPRGTFKIINKAINPGGPFGVRWLGLNAPNGDYGIHGTNNPNSIGKEISNGCIRMYNNDVVEVSNLVSIGTTVRII